MNYLLKQNKDFRILNDLNIIFLNKSIMNIINTLFEFFKSIYDCVDSLIFDETDNLKEN